MKHTVAVALLFAIVLFTPNILFAQTQLIALPLIGTSSGNPCNQGGAAVTLPQTATSTHRAQPADPYDTAFNYLITFYPRWYTYNQAVGPCNKLIGPDRISPVYHYVVAINDDTYYASAFINVSQEPVIVTLPSTTTVYSVLQLDLYGNLNGYGNVFSGIPSNQPGVYGLVGPHSQGALPEGVRPIAVPYDYTVLIVRADKYLSDGTDKRLEAQRFRHNLHLATLSDYLKDPNSGQTSLLPEIAFSIPYRQIAFYLIANDPVGFLTQLQTAVHAVTTQPLTSDQQQLSDEFDTLFMNQDNYPQMVAGAQDAHNLVQTNYLTHTLLGTTWITFTNIARWNQTFQGYLDRSSITDYIQYANNHTAAAYYHSFMDSNGEPLDGSLHSYTLTFPPNGTPPVSRFWSLTAYLPNSIELVPNIHHKYVVAKYTPGLVTNGDGTITILMSTSLPPGFPEPNWLPVPSGPFNVMLRAYGPQGTVLNNTYLPPPVVPQPDLEGKSLTYTK